MRSALLLAAWVFRAKSLELTVYNSTALAGALLTNTTVDVIGSDALPDEGPFTAVFAGMIHAPRGSEFTFSMESDAGWVRLWVDDHQMIDAGVGVPTPLSDGYVLWEGQNIDTPGHTMQDVGGDCSQDECGTLAKCQVKCDSLRDQGCIGFVTKLPGQVDNCYMRKLDTGAGEATCGDAMDVVATFNTVTRPSDCGGPAAVQTFRAKYAIPVPFLPGATASRIRVEFTVASGVRPAHLSLRTDGAEVPTEALNSEVPAAERQYFEERAAAEVGWNTWLSGDMLTHALLPHGLALSLSFHSGSDSIAQLGANGPKCDRKQFPATHGLHDIRGEYTEIESLDFAGVSYKVESTTLGGEILLLVTRLGALPAAPAAAEAAELRLEASVPGPWAPRTCAVHGGAALLRAECPGLPAVALRAVDGAARPTETGFVVSLPVKEGAAVAFQTGEGELMSLEEVVTAVGAARRRLEDRTAAFGGHADTYAGLLTAISWNVIYTPLEGIFTPVFRGSPWSVSKPHNYVLFEWDTYFASMIAAHTDAWVSKSNIIRMSKSLIYKGFVAGFWNGVCGETDKSKPPVGGLALEYFVERAPEQNLWVAELVLDQLVTWNRWWNTTRMKEGMLAPGSSREMMSDPTQCSSQDSLLASRCETGLDNSPLYTGAGYEAKFIDSENVIDSVDVGMTALYVRDCVALAKLAKKLGRGDYAAELTERAGYVQDVVNSRMWSSDENIYLNRMWQIDEWIPRGKTGAAIVAPTNFYPMMTGAPTDDQAVAMVGRWLANATEFCVSADCGFGLPSISRSSSAFDDNDYWRGRSWGPMNWLVYLGLQEYSHLGSVVEVRKALAAQSEATFLMEWTANHRVMENFNSVSGVGCDVGNAIPFYHWGALNALIPLLEAGLLGDVASSSVPLWV